MCLSLCGSLLHSGGLLCEERVVGFDTLSWCELCKLACEAYWEWRVSVS